VTAPASRDDYAAAIRAAANADDFLRLTFAGAQRGADLPWEKVTVRPVLVKRERALPSPLTFSQLTPTDLRASSLARGGSRWPCRTRGDRHALLR